MVLCSWMLLGIPLVEKRFRVTEKRIYESSVFDK